MSFIQIGSIQHENKNSCVSAEITVGSERHRVYFQSSGAQLNPNLESFIAIALLPAMKLRLPVIVNGEVSQRFLHGIDNIQSLYLSWKPRYKRVDIQGARPVERTSHSQRVGAFFSAGMDSYYTLLKKQDEINDLVFIHGFDQLFNEIDGRKKIKRMLVQVGEHFYKNVIEIETNAREFIERYIFWGLGHGAPLAAIGHLLSDEFRLIYIASSFTSDRLRPWGTDPRLDPEWGSESLCFEHHGIEANRIDKTALISKSKIALQTLRVCLNHPNGVYNCGYCEKCRRAMIYLRAFGVQDQCVTFDKPLDLTDLNRLDLSTAYLRYSIERTLELVESRGDDPAFESALSEVLSKPVGPARFRAVAINARRSIRKLTKKVGRKRS